MEQEDFYQKEFERYVDDVTGGAACGEGEGCQEGRDRLVGQAGLRTGADEHLPGERLQASAVEVAGREQRGQPSCQSKEQAGDEGGQEGEAAGGAVEGGARRPRRSSAFSCSSCLFMTKRPGKKKRKLGVWDISRAHFMGRAEREIYIQLLEEDRTREEDTGVPMCGRLLRSMYGTQDASHIFQKDYSNWLCEKGAEFSPLCPALFKIEGMDLCGLVHGDDFMATAADEELMELDKILNTRYTARWEAKMGDGPGGDKDCSS